MQQVNIIPTVLILDVFVVAEFIICSVVIVDGRKLHILVTGKKFILCPGDKLPPTFREGFVVNFVTYTRVYTVSFLWLE